MKGSSRFVAMLALAASFCGSTSRAQSSQERDGAHARLTATVELKLLARPLDEIAAVAAERSGVPVRVDRAVGQWKATVAWAGSLESLLRAICANFGLVLEQEENSTEVGRGRVGWLLKLSDEQRARVATYRAEKARKESERRARDAKLLADQLQGLLGAADRILDAAPGPGGASPLVNGAKPVLLMLGSFGQDAIGRLSASSEMEPGTAVDKSPSLAVPVESLTGAQRQLLRGFLSGQQRYFAGSSSGGVVAGLLGDGMQRLDSADLGFWTANVNGAQTLHMSVHFPGMDWSPDFPIVSAPSSADSVDPGRQDADTAQSPANSTLPGATGNEQRSISLKVVGADYPSAMLAVHQAAQVNVVADAFTLRERLTAYPEQRPLGELLRRLSALFHVARTWSDGALLVRSEHWEDLEEQEPPASVLDRLTKALDASGDLNLPDMVFAATHLNRQQTIGLSRWHDNRDHELMGTASALLSHRVLYSWLGMLTARQIEAIQGVGVIVGSLDIRPRRALEQLVAASGRSSAAPASRLRVRADQSVYPPTAALQVWAADGSLAAETR